jgi:two-component system chemotaxis response regulator CheB
VPVVIVQHIAAGFLQGLASWLTRDAAFPVKVADHGEGLLPGHGYLAPDNFQMGVDRSYRIVLSEDDPENALRPSVSYLFRSVAHSFGKSGVGVLLTGMGKDGAKELGLMKEKGAITIAQDEESSVIYGMPGEAVALDAVTHVLPPDEIAAKLRRLAICGGEESSQFSVPSPLKDRRLGEYP